MTSEQFCVFFYTICINKKNIVQLPLKDLQQFKCKFYSLNIPEWCLNSIWEYLWDYKTFFDVVYIFKSKKLI